MDAVRKWQFKPALKDGKAIASTVDVPVEFKLGQQ
jgi:outer membrane biosynthesis protein TonB